MAETPNADVKKLAFEKALAELEQIVQKLERGDVALEESVSIYERGEALKRRCEELLRLAEARVEKITLDAAGEPVGTEPLDVKRRLSSRPSEARAGSIASRLSTIALPAFMGPRISLRSPGTTVTASCI